MGRLRVELFLGGRLVGPRHALTLALGGSAGVAAVVLALALFNNYVGAVVGLLVGLHPHVLVTGLDLSGDGWRRAEDAVRDLPGVVAYGPAIHAPVAMEISLVSRVEVPCTAAKARFCNDPGVLLPPEIPRRRAWRERASKTSTVLLRGVGVGPRSPIEGMQPLLTAGRPLAELEGREEPAFVLERSFLPGALWNDDLLVTIEGRPRLHARLHDTLEVGLGSGDLPLMVTSLETARALLTRPGFANAMEVRTSDPRRAPEVAAALHARLGPPARVRSWMDLSGGSQALLAVLRAVVFLIMTSVVVVAALAVVSTLTLIVAENTSRIAVLRSMGLRSRSIFRLFLLRCAGIAALSLVVGTLAGWTATLLLLRAGAVRAALARLGIENPTVMIDGLDLLAVAAMTLATFVATAIPPARQACRIDVVQGLQG